jgi:hypothetical protein
MVETGLARREESALAFRPETPTSIARSLEQEAVDIAAALKIAEHFAKSELIPKALQGKPSDVLIVLLMGRDFGWSAMQSVRLIDVIQGKPVINAAGKMGLCLSSPVCEFFELVESTHEKATYRTKRRGASAPRDFTYTIHEATTAGLTTKDNWRRMPREMLRARASSNLANIVYADIVGGLLTAEEARDIEERDMGFAERVSPTKERVDLLTGEVFAPPPPPTGSTPPETEAPAEREPSKAPANTLAEELEKGAYQGGTPEGAAKALIARLRAAKTGDEMRAVAKETASLPLDLQDAVQFVYGAEKPRVVELEAQRKKGGGK